MGCCLSRPKDEKLKPDYSTETSINKRINSEREELIDTKNLGSKLVAKDRYGTEKPSENKKNRLQADKNIEGKNQFNKNF
jgi:hypothetical protein